MSRVRIASPAYLLFPSKVDKLEIFNKIIAISFANLPPVIRRMCEGGLKTKIENYLSPIRIRYVISDFRIPNIWCSKIGDYVPNESLVCNLRF